MKLSKYNWSRSFFFFPLLAISLNGCTPDIDDLFGNYHDPEFKGDDGTHFDAIVNGQPWYPVWGGGFSNWGIWYCDYWKHSQHNYYHFELEVNRWTEDQSRIYIEIDSVSGTGSYTLADSSTGSCAIFNRVSERVFMTSTSNTGVVEITNIDTTKRQITGTVHFKAASTDSTIEIQNGSFIMDYH